MEPSSPQIVRKKGHPEKDLGRGSLRFPLVQASGEHGANRGAGAVVRRRAGDAIAVRGLDELEIARVAAGAGVLVTELAPRRTTLSDAFIAAVGMPR